MEIPYPPVFRDWEFDNRRVATANGVAGISIESTMGIVDPAQWQRVELTEEDACLFAASVLQRVAHVNGDPSNKKLLRLVDRILKVAEEL